MQFDPSDAAVREQALRLIEQAAIPLTEQERSRLLPTDFGLNNFMHEGVVLLDVLRTPVVRISVLVLLPNQTLPEHCHPCGPHGPGKEETVQCLAGEFRVYRPGKNSLLKGFIPTGKEHCYTVFEETVLLPSDKVIVFPDQRHWFQAGPEGAVGITFQNTIDESYNQFTDPAVTSACGIPLRTAST
jgi:D-lyxose ketol-isomerase